MAVAVLGASMVMTHVVGPAPDVASRPGVPADQPLSGAADGFAGRAGDFDGNRRDDVVAFTRGEGGDVYVARSTGTRFDGIGDLWSDTFAFWSQAPLTGDFDGDGRSDVAAFARGNKPTVTVALSTGRSFGPPQVWATSFAPNVEIPAVGDVNGDGRDDVLAFRRGHDAVVSVALSTGRSFGAATPWHGHFATGASIPVVGDVNGDGRDDVVAFTRYGAADVAVALSTGRSFGRAAWWSGWFAEDQALPGLGDVNGDGRADAVAFARGRSAEVTVALSTGRSFQRRPTPWLASWATREAVPGLGDFNGDGRDDVAAFTRGGRADVHVALSTGGSFRETPERWHEYFAAATEIPQPGILW
ncbi:FG-GAP repeat domain-containing protein [Cryptosporangium aurantiacum]|uniref:FG-GAP repeat domain-containing protein n=1 Tax=Cryptosporangium aurantiacum TaxID=134849 RepID=UPI0011611C1B|nr:VCBS repeat-containing protein [Cryptosporangium aurantiacum]